MGQFRALWFWAVGLSVACLAGCQRAAEAPSTSIDYSYYSAADGTSRKVVYENVRGLAIAEGDIDFGTVEALSQVRHAVEQGRTARSAIAVKRTDRRWPDGVVPYAIEADLPKAERVTAAIRQMEAKTSLRFVERTDETDYVVFVKDEELCSSHVGRKGGEQKVRLADNCSEGTVIHELGHVAGLWHEQSRSDRDDHIEVLWDNIKEGKTHNFDQKLNDGIDVGKYDYGSIMHYGAKAFSDNGKPTIALPNGVKATIGQRKALSKGDIAALKELYP